MQRQADHKTTLRLYVVPSMFFFVGFFDAQKGFSPLLTVEITSSPERLDYHHYEAGPGRNLFTRCSQCGAWNRTGEPCSCQSEQAIVF